jgi:nucleoid DNA-binding protein
MAVKKKAAKAPKTIKAPSVNPSKVPSKGEVFGYIAEACGLSRKQVSMVFEALGKSIQANLTKGPGIFAVPGMMKITVVKKPATKARKGVNPFTGEEMIFKAKPARKVIKVRPLKGLKAMVA